MIDPFLPDVRKIRLNPRNPMRFHQCATIGYFWGEVPSIIAEVGGDRFEIKMGQCIPVAGRDVAIENPYSRTATVQIAINAAPQFQPSADTDLQDAYVTYQANVFIAAEANPEVFQGVGIMPTSGPIMVEYESQSNLQQVAFGKAEQSFLDVKPVGFMDELSIDFLHVKSTKIDGVIGIGGTWTGTLMGDWIVAAGLGWEDRKIISNGFKTGRQLVEPGSALFLTHPFEQNFNVDIRIREFATTEGVANV